MTVTVHMGLAKTGTTTLQTQYFSQCPEIRYLGKNSGDEFLDRAGKEITRQHTEKLDLAGYKARFDSELEKGGAGVFSDEDLSVWKFFHPSELGRRTAFMFPKPKLIYVVRKPTDWVLSQYYFRLSTYRRDTFSGPNAWLEKHLSQLRVGSDLAEIQFVDTLDLFAAAADPSDVLILPYELMRADGMGFLQQVEAFIGVPGALTKLYSDQAVEKKTRLNPEQANYMRTLHGFDRDRDAFLEATKVYARYARPDVGVMHQTLLDRADATLDEWIVWFRKAQRGVFTALAKGDETLTKALQTHADYRPREGLMAHVLEVEQEQTAKMAERHGIDLTAWGYGPPSDEPAA